MHLVLKEAQDNLSVGRGKVAIACQRDISFGLVMDERDDTGQGAVEALGETNSFLNQSV